MSYDYEYENLKVTIQDSGVPSGGRFVAKIEYWIEGNDHPSFQQYVYGLTKNEALENAKAWVEEYKVAKV